MSIASNPPSATRAAASRKRRTSRPMSSVVSARQVTTGLATHELSDAETGAGRPGSGAPARPAPTVSWAAIRPPASCTARIDTDAFVPTTQHLTNAVHDAGGRIAAQLTAGAGR